MINICPDILTTPEFRAVTRHVTDREHWLLAALQAPTTSWVGPPSLLGEISSIEGSTGSVPDELHHVFLQASCCKAR